MVSRPHSTKSASEADEFSPIQEEVVADNGNVSAPTETTPLVSGNGHRTTHRRRSKLRLHPILILLAVFGTAIGVSLLLNHLLGEFTDPPATGAPGTDPRGRRHPAVLARGNRAAVAAENVICSEIGIDVLKEHGTAVDAAVASTLCVGVLNMFSSGIGGGGFMIIRDPSPCYESSSPKSPSDCAEHVTIDFRETAPSGANKTMYIGRRAAAQIGGLAVGVPGELRGLQEAHSRYGKLPWRRLVEPSVALARQATVSKELARRLTFFGGFMVDDPIWRAIFVDESTGELKKEGDTFHRTAYAETLDTIARHGVDAFYTGRIAESLVKAVRQTGGILTKEDLQKYKVVTAPAVEGRWQGRKIFTTPAPTSGPILLSILNILSGFPDFVTSGPTGLNMHRFVEALKFGFGQRTELADPAFMHDDDLDRIAEIPTMEEANRLRPNLTDDRTHPLDYYHPKFDIVDDHGTMHLSVVDENGMAVALTSTVNLIFGSRVMDPVTGVILNDEMDDTSTPGVPNAFGLAPSPFNYPESGKRPLSSTCPTIVEDADGNFLMAIGGSGGSRIFSAVLQTIFLYFDWSTDLSTSIELPRLHHQLLPTQLSVETTYDEKVLNALKGRGHEVSFLDIDLGVAEVQAVAFQGTGRHKQVFAASDSRKGGVAVAY